MKDIPFHRPEYPLRHERVPRTDIFIDGEPVYILGRGAEREEEKPLQLSNIDVAGYLADFVKTAFGPQGLDKIIMAQEGKSIITYISNDAEMLFRKIPLQNPIAQFLAGAAVATSREVGDGTITSMILSGEILRNCGKLIERGIRPSIIQDGCIEVMKRVLQIIDQNAIQAQGDDEIVKQVVKTSLTSGCVLEFRDLIADMMVNLIKSIDNRHLEDVMRSIEVKNVVGGWMGDSRLVRGCAFYREPLNLDMPEKVENARIAILKGGLKIPERGRTRHLEHKGVIETTQRYGEFKKQRIQILKGIVDRVSSVGANVLFIEKGIDELIADYLVKSRILTIRRFPPPELERVVEATGARMVADINVLEESDLGEAEIVRLEKIKGEPWWFIEGCRNLKVNEFLLRGANSQMLGEAERAFKSMFKVLSVFYRDKRLAAGGGALEMEIASRLRGWMRSVSGKKQMIINAVADAFESIPSTLIKNSGIKPIDILPELRVKHSQGAVHTGYDVYERKVTDMIANNVLEPIQVKIQEVKTAFEAAYTILRIDDFILCRQLPKPEADYVKRMEGTAPDRVKKIKKEYGV